MYTSLFSIRYFVFVTFYLSLYLSPYLALYLSLDKIHGLKMRSQQFGSVVKLIFIIIGVTVFIQLQLNNLQVFHHVFGDLQSLNAVIVDLQT